MCVFKVPLLNRKPISVGVLSDIEGVIIEEEADSDGDNELFVVFSTSEWSSAFVKVSPSPEITAG